MGNKIITISRQFGSGGRTIGKKVADKLGIKCYDAQLILELAKESGFSEEYIKEASEYTPGNYLANLFTNRSFGQTNEDTLWNLQYKIISDIASRESCVIVGRCADYILGDNKECLKVFIHANDDYRANRIVKEYGEKDVSPKDRLQDKDKRRAAYYNFYTNMKWGYAKNYDVSLDSSKFGIDECVDIICDLYKKK